MNTHRILCLVVIITSIILFYIFNITPNRSMESLPAPPYLNYYEQPSGVGFGKLPIEPIELPL